MDLEVVGRHALLFDDDAIAAFVNSAAALVDWNSLSIDRYDVRHLLPSPPPPRNRRRQQRSPSPNLDDSLESELDYERYLDLPSASDKQDLGNEAERNDADGYHMVAFSYGASSESTDQKNTDTESSFQPPFSVPEQLMQNLPPTEKVHQIIARTAMFVSKHGGQSEIILRVKQGDNPTFGFLMPDHNLHPYFRFLVDHQELLKSDIDGKSIEDENKIESGDQMGGALSLLGSVYGSGEDEEGAHEDAPAFTKNDFEESVNAADNATISHGSEQNNPSLNAAGKDDSVSKPPFSSLKERSHVVKRNRSISTVKVGTTTGVKRDGDSTTSVSSAVDKLQPFISHSLSKVEPSILEPPADLKRVVDKIVEFILRNGKEFESVLVQQDTKHGRFPFLLPTNQYHPYYLKALQKAQESKLAGKSFISEKLDSLGHGMDRKTGTKESDALSLASDIPYESDRKEKFKMVIGKSKKDGQDPPSKITQPQVGVSVDAAAAILQAATKGIKNPNLEMLSKTISGIGHGPSSEAGDSLLSSCPQSSNQKSDKIWEHGVSIPVAKAIAKTMAVAAASEADSSEARLTREQKLKAERLKRAKMFAAMIKGGAAPLKSEPLRGLSVEPSESGLSGSDSHALHPTAQERESKIPLEIDTHNRIEKSADEYNERRSKRSYRSRSKRAEDEDEEEEELKDNRDHKHSRVHFHWSKIESGDEYIPVASVGGSINSSGGAGDNGGLFGEEGTVTGKKCPKGLYGTFCKECPVGTYKEVEGSDESLCTPCSFEHLPNRANFIYVRGGVSGPPCPYKCISDKYRMPNCYTPLEELIYTFGGPWPFALLLSCLLVLLALLLSTLRIKLVGSGSSYGVHSIDHQSHHHFPHLLSLSEVRGTRAEETQSHVYRMYFMGPNTFREPWHLPYSPPNAIIEIVYEDAFNRFIDEINSVAAYDWWEGSVHSILSVLAYPCAWSWKQWRQRNKIHRLQEYVKSEYDHSCLRSCRSRALYKGMKVGATPDLMVAYIDFFLGGDEKRLDIVSIIKKRFPMCIIFGGDGSYMSPYSLHSDSLLTNLLGQHVPPSVWNRLVAGLNAQLRTVRHGSIRSALLPVIDWINSHANPQLDFHGVKIELGWFQATASGYYQLGILVMVGEYSFYSMHQSDLLDRINSECARKSASCTSRSLKQLQQDRPYMSQVLSRKKMTGGINGGLINDATLKSLEYKRDFLFPFSLLLHNTRPVGRQDTLQLFITIMLLADLSITLLALLQFYWISLGAFLAVLLILPLSLLSPFPAGLNALFSREPRRASLARIYALWNATSLSNIAVAFICGIVHYGFSSFQPPDKENTLNIRREDDKWWLLPTILLLLKSIQARFVDWHIANLEMQDFSLFCPDPDTFWAHESSS